MAKTHCGLLVSKRLLVKKHKAESHLQNVKKEKRLQIINKIKDSIECMENKIEVIKYHLK
jgi:hypothetical protein